MVEEMPLVPFLLSLLLLLLCTGNGAYGYEDKEILYLDKLVWKQKSSIENCFSHKSRKENGATVLELKHRDDCHGTVLDLNERLQKRLISDGIQVQHLQTRIRTIVSGEIQELSQAQIPLTSGVKLQTLNYIVTVNLGGRNMPMIVDSGSDLTWVQCQPCKLCYNQPGPPFNPSLSHSYQPILCNSLDCEALQLATGNVGACGTNPPTCNYDVSYGDGSYTSGELAHEQLILGTTTVDGFVFGCGRNNKGLFGGASGLMGLGRSDLSLISQAYDIFGGVFSYCLPSSEADDSGTLNLGGDDSVYKNSTPFSYTRMLANPQLSTFYFLNLTGIRIGGAALQSPSFGKGGILIDSGTIITRLPPSIYRQAKAEFLIQFSGFPAAPGFSILDTCFNLSSYQEVSIPTIRMQFEGGGELKVDVNGVLYFVKADASQVCLALASLEYENDIGIIGNYQQKNRRVIYDTKQSRLGFAEESCSFI